MLDERVAAVEELVSSASDKLVTLRQLHGCICDGHLCEVSRRPIEQKGIDVPHRTLMFLDQARPKSPGYAPSQYVGSRSSPSSPP